MFTKITEERAFDGILAQIIENIRRGELKPTLHGNRYKFFYKDVSAYIEKLKRSRDRDCDNSGTCFLNFILN